MPTKGFTMLELTVSMGILSVVALLGMVAVRASASTVATTEALSQVQSCVRDTMRVLQNELQMSAKRSNPSLTPPLQTAQINANPAAGAPVELVFQTPVDLSGQRWSRTVRYRFIYEDANNNNRLDPNEDTDRNGVLTRCILRMQDRNGDGDTADPGEAAPIGGSNDFRDVAFARNGDVITITLTANRLVGTRRNWPVTATETARVYLLN